MTGSEIFQIRGGDVVFHIIPCQIVVNDGIDLGNRFFRVVYFLFRACVPLIMGFAFFLPCLAFPCISGTGGASFRGFVCVQSGRAIPCFDMMLTSEALCPICNRTMHLKSTGPHGHPAQHIFLFAYIISFSSFTGGIQL